MKKELLIWIAAVVAILSFFIYVVNKIINIYEGDMNERYKNKKCSRQDY